MYKTRGKWGVICNEQRGNEYLKNKKGQIQKLPDNTNWIIQGRYLLE